MDFLVSLLTWENFAVLLAVAYLVLAMRENAWCWLAGFVSTAIYTVLFWNVNLLMESGLNVFYMGMAVYGWWQWKYGGEGHEGVPIRRWSWSQHVTTVAFILVTSVLFGLLLSARTSAAWPFVDSFTTVSAVITTFMVARKVLENWIYWIVIDTVDIVLYADRGLESTAVLYAAYVVLAVFGFLAWHRRYRAATDGLDRSRATLRPERS